MNSSSATKKNATPPSSPEGLALNLAYSVGRQLGSGAQASVYAVVNRSTQQETDWVVKMAPLPNKLALPKKKKSLLEINADSLNGEYHVYDLFKTAQGTVIPTLPLWKNAQRDVPVRGELTNCTYCGNERLPGWLVRVIVLLCDVIPTRPRLTASSRHSPHIAYIAQANPNFASSYWNAWKLPSSRWWTSCCWERRGATTTLPWVHSLCACSNTFKPSTPWVMSLSMSRQTISC